MSKPSKRPISGFIASILNLILAVIVISVVLRYSQARKEGRDINLTTIIVEQVHDVWTDAKTAWTSKKDSIK
ncbi:MAG: hypothetical protein ACFFKA_00105 [Candidatus Thorarchaeota archaeon]